MTHSEVAVVLMIVRADASESFCGRWGSVTSVLGICGADASESLCGERTVKMYATRHRKQHAVDHVRVYMHVRTRVYE